MTSLRCRPVLRWTCLSHAPRPQGGLLGASLTGQGGPWGPTSFTSENPGAQGGMPVAGEGLSLFWAEEQGLEGVGSMF